MKFYLLFILMMISFSANSANAISMSSFNTSVSSDINPSIAIIKIADIDIKDITSIQDECCSLMSCSADTGCSNCIAHCNLALLTLPIFGLQFTPVFNAYVSVSYPPEVYDSFLKPPARA